MERELAMEWAKDLRENADKQGMHALNENGRFCCLGRLAEICGYERSEPNANGIVEYGFGGDINSRSFSGVELRDGAGGFRSC